MTLFVKSAEAVVTTNIVIAIHCWRSEAFLQHVLLIRWGILAVIISKTEMNMKTGVGVGQEEQTKDYWYLKMLLLHQKWPGNTVKHSDFTGS